MMQKQINLVEEERGYEHKKYDVATAKYNPFSVNNGQKK